MVFSLERCSRTYIGGCLAIICSFPSVAVGVERSTVRNTRRGIPRNTGRVLPEHTPQAPHPDNVRLHPPRVPARNASAPFLFRELLGTFGREIFHCSTREKMGSDPTYLVREFNSYEKSSLHSPCSSHQQGVDRSLRTEANCYRALRRYPFHPSSGTPADGLRVALSNAKRSVEHRDRRPSTWSSQIREFPLPWSCPQRRTSMCL